MVILDQGVCPEFYIFGAMELGLSFEVIFTIWIGISVLYSILILFHESIFIFGI